MIDDVDDDSLLDEFGLAGTEGEPAHAPTEAPEQSPPQATDGGGFLTKEQFEKFAKPNPLGNGIAWDTEKEAVNISVDVSFVQACTLNMTIFGKAVT